MANKPTPEQYLTMRRMMAINRAATALADAALLNQLPVEDIAGMVSSLARNKAEAVRDGYNHIEKEKHINSICPL